MHNILKVILIGIILSLSACAGQDDDVVAFVDNVKKTAVGTINELPPEKPVVVEEYTASNLRSPFDNSNKATDAIAVAKVEQQVVKQAPRPDAGRTKEFLEKYPLADFIMVGTLMKKNFIWGLVQTKDGMVHAVKVGDYIGENSGHVTDIIPDKIILNQTIPNGKGGWMESTAEILLKEDRSNKNEENKQKE